MASSYDVLRALTKGDRLGLVAAIRPAAYDVIPRGPLRSAVEQRGIIVVGGLEQRGIIVIGGVEQVALNPQPLPPKESFAVGAQLTHLVLGAALAGGADSAGAFLAEVDDWCGTGWPRRWPFPWPPEPEPDPRWRADVFLGAALAAADLAGHYPEGEMQDALGKAAEQLLEQAIAG